MTQVRMSAAQVLAWCVCLVTELSRLSGAFFSDDEISNTGLAPCYSSSSFKAGISYFRSGSWHWRSFAPLGHRSSLGVLLGLKVPMTTGS
jgi:hypothetical protein